MKVTQPKKGLSRIEIDIKSEEETYNYVIELYDSGKAYIHVRPLHKDPITFDGEFVPKKD